MSQHQGHCDREEEDDEDEEREGKNLGDQTAEPVLERALEPVYGHHTIPAY
jgi:hypothetical protein